MMRNATYYLVFSIVVAVGTNATASLTSEVSLSPGAESSLVAFFDARTGVNATGNVVNSWDGYNADGSAIVATLTSIPRPAGGAPELITTDGETVFFDDVTVSNQGRRLEGALSTSAAGSSYTIIWKGHYDSDNRNGFENSGLYAYNIGSEMSHQRDNGGGTFNVELFDGSTNHIGDSIVAFDDIDTVWTTVYEPGAHTAYANGVNLNVAGTPNYNVADDPTIIMGAFSSSGFDMLGQISQFAIFEQALSSEDIAAVESYFASIPEPASLIVLALAGAMIGTRRRNH